MKKTQKKKRIRVETRDKYECDNCDYETTIKKDFEGHLNRKISCEEKIHKCNACNKIFTRAESLNYHIEHEVCKKKTNIKQKINIKGNIKGNNNNNNINVGRDLIINLCPFGEEDPNDLSNKFYKKIVPKGLAALQSFVKAMYFNKNLPAHHTICISNYNKKTLQIFENDEWVTKQSEELSDTIDRMYMLLRDQYKAFEKKPKKYGLNENDLDKIKEFINEYQDQKDDVHKGIIPILYNKRRLPLEAKKRYEKQHGKKIHVDNDDDNSDDEFNDPSYYNPKNINIKKNESDNESLSSSDESDNDSESSSDKSDTDSDDDYDNKKYINSEQLIIDHINKIIKNKRKKEYIINMIKRLQDEKDDNYTNKKTDLLVIDSIETFKKNMNKEDVSKKYNKYIKKIERRL